MKIVIHSLGELRELAAMIHAANYGRSMTAASVGAELQNRLDESDGSPERDVTAEATAGTALKWAIPDHVMAETANTTTSFRPADYLDSPETASHYVAEAASANKPEHLADAVASGQLDAAGVAWDAAVHASSRALNKDGTWRVKRGLAKADAAPAPAPAPAAGDTVDFAGLLAAAEAASGDQSDNLIALLDASKAFIGTHSTRAFNALKAAVAADEHGAGKPIPQLTPAERRTLMAALSLYDEHGA